MAKYYSPEELEVKILRKVLGGQKFTYFEQQATHRSNYLETQEKYENYLSDVPSQELTINLKNFDNEKIRFSDIFDCDIDQAAILLQKFIYEHVTLKSEIESRREQLEYCERQQIPIDEDSVKRLRGMRIKNRILSKFLFFAERRWMIEGPLGKSARAKIIESLYKRAEEEYEKRLDD